jgi:uncharacterized protein YjbI with pentapeptide repeats
MDAKTVREIFKNLPPKRKQVLLRVLADDSKQKIACELCDGSEDAVQQNLRQLYKNFHIDGDRERKQPALIKLFARCMPELLGDRIPDVLDGVEQEEAIANEPTVTNPLESDTAPKISIEVSSFLEYFSKSIDQLKSKDLDVRIGAISTLETIAKYSQPAEHWTIMEYLAAFVRTNAPRKEEGEEKRSPKIPDDIQAALTVIGRRNSEKDPPNLRLDLSKTDIRGALLTEANLQGAILSKANLQGADLKDAKLQGADLNEANLQRAKLSGAELQKATLSRANLERAVLNGAELQGAILDYACLEMAYLWYVNLQEAKLPNTKLKGAILREADLKGATLDGADLKGAFLNGANLEGVFLDVANLEGANLSEAKNLKSLQLETAFGDSQTLLPDDVEAPARWQQSGELQLRSALT